MSAGLTIWHVLGLKGGAAVLVATAICAALSSWTAVNYLALDASSCDPVAYYLSGDKDKWRKFMAPPMTGQVSDTGTCINPQVAGYDQGFAAGEAIPSKSATFRANCNCPGCPSDWADTYDVNAPRFNKCLKKAFRHYGKCTPHIDCTNEYTAYHIQDRHAFELRDGARCPYIDIESFLSACEAKTSFADFRENSGWILLVAFGLPALVYLFVVLHMTLGWRGRMQAEMEHLAKQEEARAAGKYSSSVLSHGAHSRVRAPDTVLPNQSQAPALGQDNPASDDASLKDDVADKLSRMEDQATKASEITCELTPKKNCAMFTL